MGGEFMRSAAREFIGISYDERASKAERIIKSFENFLHPGMRDRSRCTRDWRVCRRHLHRNKSELYFHVLRCHYEGVW
jgi:hypothetical protein